MTSILFFLAADCREYTLPLRESLELGKATGTRISPCTRAVLDWRVDLDDFAFLLPRAPNRRLQSINQIFNK